MFEQTFETSATPHITVGECLENLVVRGSERRRVAFHVQGGAEDATLEREGETFTLTARADCLIACPPETTLTIDGVRGNLRVEGVTGPITGGTVNGNVKLRDVGPTALEQTFGNLSARRVAGELRAEITRGNAQAGHLEGPLSLNRVDGNLVAAGLEGGLAADQVRGNVQLGPPFSPGQTYKLNTNGNLDVRLPHEASLRLAIQTRGGLRSRMPDLALEKTDEEARGVLGAGEANLEAQVDGNVTLRPAELTEGPTGGVPFEFVANLEGLGARIEARIAEEMAEMEARLAENLGRVEDEGVRRRMERAGERARRAAEGAAQRARRQAEQEAERARLRAERAERRWRRASGRRSHPPRAPVMDKERMRVLRMVEDGKITPEQAADLLAALEGQ
jgi:hypothetical protein